MNSKTVTLADAKTRLSELTELATQGETIVITKRGKPVAQVTKPTRAKKPVSLEALRALTSSLPRQPEGAGKFIRKMRDSDRY